MNRNTIIHNLYIDKDINKAISKMQPIELQEDLKQELFLVISEMSEERLMDMYDKGYIKFFIVRTMLNMMKSDRSNFYKQFRKSFNEYNDKIEIAIENNETLIEVVNDKMDELYWYDKEVFSLYANTGKNIVKLSKETNIPYRSLFKTINKVKKEMKSAIRNIDIEQKKLIGCYVVANCEIVIDISKSTNTDEMMDIMDDISNYIKNRIGARVQEDVTIKHIKELKIKRII